MIPVHILLVEDNEGDILLTTEALDEGLVANKLSVVRDGEDAVSFLEKKGKFKEAPTPDLVLLDVNLPKRSGHEVLHYIKENDYLKQIPVIMLTTSSAANDINLSYRNHANCYITKPIDIDNFINVIAKIEDFWISIVKLPSGN